MNYVRCAAFIAAAGWCSAQAAFALAQTDLNDCNNVYLHQNMDRAIAACTRLIDEIPKNMQDGLYVNRGIAHKDARQFEEALADFNTALELSPRLAGALHERLDLYEKTGEFDKAIADAARELEIEPNDPMALDDRCRSRAEANKELDAALADCELALKLDPSGHPGWRAFVKLRQGKFADAIADYDAAIKMYPKSQYFWFGRGIAKLRTGETAGGNADIAAAEAIKSDVRATFARCGIAP